MAAKDAQAREKAKSVEARHAALVLRTGVAESSVSTLQHQLTTLSQQITTLQQQVTAINNRLSTTNFAGLRAVNFTGHSGGAPSVYANQCATWVTDINSQLNAIIGNLG
jgi:uncharacterized coiled-coil protein SlyX